MQEMVVSYKVIRLNCCYIRKRVLLRLAEWRCTSNSSAVPYVKHGTDFQLFPILIFFSVTHFAASQNGPMLTVAQQNKKKKGQYLIQKVTFPHEICINLFFQLIKKAIKITVNFCLFAFNRCYALLHIMNAMLLPCTNSVGIFIKT